MEGASKHPSIHLLLHLFCCISVGYSSCPEIEMSQDIGASMLMIQSYFCSNLSFIIIIIIIIIHKMTHNVELYVINIFVPS